MGRYQFSNGHFYKARYEKWKVSSVQNEPEGVRAILQAQRELLDESAESMQTSQFVFRGFLVDNVNWIPTFSIFAEFEILQVLPKDFRPNYYLRDTIATRLLSSGL